MTIKHAAITSLDMPAMTMVFKAGEPEQLKNIQAGEKIEFRAENVAGAFVLTEIKAVKQLRKLLLAPAAEGADFSRPWFACANGMERPSLLCGRRVDANSGAYLTGRLSCKEAFHSERFGLLPVQWTPA